MKEALQKRAESQKNASPRHQKPLGKDREARLVDRLHQVKPARSAEQRPPPAFVAQKIKTGRGLARSTSRSSARSSSPGSSNGSAEQSTGGAALDLSALRAVISQMVDSPTEPSEKDSTVAVRQQHLNERQVFWL